MRWLVIGAGGVGGFLGARLLQGGNDVTFVARGEHKNALRKSGLVIRGAEGEQTVSPLNVQEVQALRGQYDVILVAVKWTGLEDACDELPRLIAPDGVVLPLLNGLSSEEVVARYVGAQRTIAAVAYMSSGLLGPGQIYVHGNTRVGLAPFRDGQETWLAKLHSAFSAAGVPVRVHAEHRAMLWEKMVWNAPFNAICALSRKPAGAVLEQEPALVREAMLEVVRTARADGVQMVDAMADLMMQVTRIEYPNTEPSMLQDVRAGRPTEVDILQAAVVERATALGVDAPVMRSLAALVRALTK